ncbi:ZN574 protein, partial [Grantiella picta]|nr:ZN574 protein [Grantiella picta]
MSLPEETLLLVEHRYVCSECSHLSSSLEEALLHHQTHLESPQTHLGNAQTHLGNPSPHLGSSNPHLGNANPHLGSSQPHLGNPNPHLEILGVPAELDAPSQYQCLECGMLLVTPGQLLEHQELHIKLLGTTPAPPPTPKPAVSTPTPGGIHYECPECRALFQSQELWLAHRQGHRNAPLLPQNHARVDVEHSYRKPEDGDAENPEIPAEVPAESAVQLLLYECGECLQLFQSPKDFLEHQVTHL